MAHNFRDVPMPRNIAALPEDRHGHPVPWFVAWIDGRPDFRVIADGTIAAALQDRLCWICGRQRGSFAAFVIGPMCSITRTAPEPPAHRDCALYAARACPFLATPVMRRRDAGLPDNLTAPPGVAIMRNPGVALVWITKTWNAFAVDGGILFNVGDPISTHWFAEGRDATRAEVLASIDSGLPLLQAEADADPHPEQAHIELARMHVAALKHIPASGQTEKS